MTRFHTVVADPPWSYGDKLKAMKSAGSGAEKHYSCMPLDAIKALLELPLDMQMSPSIREHIADNAILWLWITNPFLVNEPWQPIVDAWGFEPKQLITWVKGRLQVTGTETAHLVTHVGQGHYTRGCTEHLVLCTRGKAKDLVLAHNVPNVFIAPRTRHSEKPDASYQLIERVSPGPYLELFARRPRAGWSSWGNEL